MVKTQIDQLDREIIAWLSKDARVSNRKIASALGVTEGTIRARIKKLEDERVIRMTAVTDASLMGHPTVAYIGIDVVQSRVREIAKEISQIEGIRFTSVMLGRYNILAIALIESADKLVDLVNNHIVAVPGVQRTQTSIAIKTIKYDFRWAHIAD